MDFAEFVGKTLRLPAVDEDDLDEEAVVLRSEFDYKLARLHDADQSNVRGEGFLSRSLLRAINLSGSSLAPVELADVALEEVDLSNASMSQATARRVSFTRCRGVGLRLTLAQASDVLLNDCKLDYAVVRIDKVKNPVVFHGCSLREAVFSGDLSQVAFVDCDLTEAEFDVSQAQNCDLRSSNLANARGLLTLRGAKISTEQAVTIAVGLATECGLSVVDAD